MKKQKLLFALILSSLLSSCGNNALSSEVIDSANESSLIDKSEEITYKQPEGVYQFSTLFSSYYDHLFESDHNTVNINSRQIELATATYDFYLKDGVDAKVISYDNDKYSLKPIENDNKVIGYSFTFNNEGFNQKVSFASEGYVYDFYFEIFAVTTSHLTVAFDFLNREYREVFVYCDKDGNKFYNGPYILRGIDKYYSKIVPGEIYEVKSYGIIQIEDWFPSTLNYGNHLVSIELISKAKVLEATLSDGKLVIEGYTNLENVFSYVYDENGNFIDFANLEDGTKLYALKMDDESDLNVCGIYTYNPYENN